MSSGLHNSEGNSQRLYKTALSGLRDLLFAMGSSTSSDPGCFPSWCWVPWRGKAWYALDTIARDKAGAIPRYDAHAYSTWLRCVSCYDGDTFTALVPGTVGTDQGWPCLPSDSGKGGGLFSFKCRVQGYDCPEMKVSRTNPDRVAIKAAAVRAALALDLPGWGVGLT